MWGSTPPRGDDRISTTVENGLDPAVQQSNASLNWETRIQCFLGAFILSVISSFSASYLLLLMKLSGFCIMTSISAILSMASTCFLMGPVSQVKSMFHKSRWLSSSLYLFFITMSIVSGLWLRSAPLALLSVGGQYLALAWYSLSYIPYAREFLSRMLCSCL